MIHNQTLPLELLPAIIDSLKLGVMVFNANCELVLWNKWLEEHSQVRAEAMMGKRFQQAFPSLVQSRVHNAILTALLRGYPSFLSQSLNRAPFDLYSQGPDLPSPVRIQQSIQVTAFHTPQGGRYCLVQVQDVTSIVQREEALRRHASEQLNYSYTDPLTQIANRRRFMDYLDEEWRRARRNRAPIAMMMADIDHLHHYNQGFGLQAGDECLQQVSKLLDRCLRRPADLLARYGGEEFAMLLPDTDLAGACKVANLALETIREAAIPLPSVKDGRSHLTISIGVAAFESGLNDLQPVDLISATDAALFMAKRLGRDRCVH